MSAVLPGRPQSRLQGLTSGFWNNRHVNAYISGSSFTILDGARTILQSVYDENEKLLEAIAIDEATGKIAVCTATEVRVYKPSGLREGTLKWALESSFNIPDSDIETTCSLSWGVSEELLVSRSSLSLYRTNGQPICSWTKKLSNPVKVATLSYDSAYVISIGQHDTIPKIWRRLTYGQDEVRFDLNYLRHPDVVTSARWRKPFHVEQAAANILYTTCLDGFVRVWAPADTADGRHWQLWGQIDVRSESLHGTPSLNGLVLCIIDGRDFTASVEKTVQDRMADDSTADDVAIEHLVAVANKNPEICLTIDSCGLMSAWALENVGYGVADVKKIFTVAQAQSEYFANLGGFLSSQPAAHVEVQAYCDKRTGMLHVLVHCFDGRVGVFMSNIADLLDPIANENRLVLHTVWSGHSTSIQKIVRNFSGRAVVSRTDANETIVWTHPGRNSGFSNIGLVRRSVISDQGQILRICLLRKGRFAVFLGNEAISLWDCRTENASCLAQCAYKASGDPLCLIILPRPNAKEYTVAHIATINSSKGGIVWEINLPRYFDETPSTEGASIREFCKFELEVEDIPKRMLPVDPAGCSPMASGFLDVFSRDVAISYTHAGRVEFWTARIDPKRQHVDWLSTCYTETSILDPALASGSMLKKVAVVDSTRSRLSIWDVGGSRLEFDADYETHNTIQDLDWTSTPDAQSILAVGFQYRVLLVSQMRFDYLNKGPAWASVREIDIRDLTPHPIGDSTWLGDGHLVIGAGNQLFVFDRRIDKTSSTKSDNSFAVRQDATCDLFEAVQRFNGPLPVFHPQFLSQCILSGKGTLVRRILVALQKTLQYLIPGEAVDDYLGLEPTEFYCTTKVQRSTPSKVAVSFLYGQRHEEHNDEAELGETDEFTENVSNVINEKLTKIRIPQLSGHEQIQLADMVECVALVERHRRSMDENGSRFMVFFRQHALRNGRAKGVNLSWREINWAYHSSSQDILIDFVSRQISGGIQWNHARESGMFMWISDINAVRQQFESIAKNEYTKSDMKNPVDCSLFYLALRKKTILQGLWRMASWNKEQVATQRLLSNDFGDPKWRRVALKNAYALLSKRRFEYAASFFLLADHLEDAVDICLHHLKDVQLAISVCRVYEGDHGPVLRRLLEEQVLPMAAQEGNRWLASWAFWMLGRKDMAVRALITPVYTLLQTPCSPDFKSRLFLTDDPALVVLYSQLRQQTLQTLRGASKVTPKVEWEFVLHSAKLYDRMGCDLLGLDLVRNWEFQQTAILGLGGEVNPLKLLRRRSSLVVDDLPHLPREATKRAFEQPSTFQEPDAGSLLDSFGL